jgi:hypothetical protein
MITFFPMEEGRQQEQQELADMMDGGLGAGGRKRHQIGSSFCHHPGEGV